MATITNAVTWKIGGEAGEGIMVTGLLFSKSCVRSGLKAFDYTEYPSLIRGGHNAYLVQIGEEDVFCHDKSVEILVALNQETIEKHAAELSKGGALIYDPDDSHIALDRVRKDVIQVPLPMSKLAVEISKNKLMRNTVALGASMALLAFPKDRALGVIQDVFKEKGEQIVASNIETFLAGYETVKSETVDAFQWKIKVKKGKGDIIVTGNEAIALGSITGGCKFYVAYPMTPATSILSYLAEAGPAYGMVVKHAEDEIAVINMALGAAHMGVRTMCGTSGGGFALMNEGYSLAAQTETPTVIVLAMRPGPATGLPTWTGQADMQYALHAGHGEFPRFVLAPGDVEECFSMTVEAMNVAERYQTPVLLLTDKQLAECHQTVPPFLTSGLSIDRGKRVTQEELDKQKNFLRYDASVSDGVSPRSFPGMAGGIYVANSDEHDGRGYTTEDSGPVLAMMQKRARKEKTFVEAMPQPQLVGQKNADITFVFWGSVKGAVKEAIKRLAAKGVQANYLQITWLSPFPAASVQSILDHVKRPVIVENSMTGQLAALIREKTGIEITENILKYDGRPFFPEDIIDHIHHGGQ